MNVQFRQADGEGPTGMLAGWINAINVVAREPVIRYRDCVIQPDALITFPKDPDTLVDRRLQDHKQAVPSNDCRRAPSSSRRSTTST
jgi:hypothetical protein